MSDSEAEHFDDELAPSERARVEQRIASDPAAQQLLEELRSVSKELKSLPHQTLGTDLRESVLHRAERAMLVSGERASTRGLKDIAQSIPIGRSKRAWLWAGAAIAAGLMLMVFEQTSDKNGDLPGQVAERSLDKSADTRQAGESRAPLEMRAIEVPPADSLKDAPAPVTSPRFTGGVAANTGDMRGRELAAKPAQESVSSGGGGMDGAAGTDAKPTLDDVADQDAASRVAATQDSARQDSNEDLVVVHVNMKPEALQNRAFDAVLLKNQIAVEEPAGKKSEKVESQEPQNVDVVFVEASPSQVYSCLSDLNKDSKNCLGIAIDDRSSTNVPEHLGKLRNSDFKQYNRGSVPNQQRVELARDNDYFYNAQQVPLNQEPATTDAEQQKFSKQATSEYDALKVEAGHEIQQRAGSSTLDLSNQGRAVRFSPSASANSVDLNSRAANSLPAPVSAGNSPAAGQRFYDEVQQDVARRARQKLTTNDDALQVLFVFQCPTHAAPATAASATAPAATENEGAASEKGAQSDKAAPTDKGD